MEVKETQIKNIGFNTSVFTGTKVKSSGDALGKIVTGALSVKKGIDKAEKEQEILDEKSSTLMFNDMKIEYQREHNEYGFKDRDNITSIENGDFHTKVRIKQSDKYDMLTENHKKAYDLFHAQKDGETEKMQSAEYGAMATNVVQQSLPHLSTINEVYELIVSLDGRVSKADFFKMAGDRAESLLDSGELKGLSSTEILELFPLMNEIKDPNIGTKFKKHIVQLQAEEATVQDALNGTEFNQSAVTHGLGNTEAKRLLTQTTSKLMSENRLGEAIDLANNNHAKIPELETLAQSMFTTMLSDVSQAHEKYKTYTNTKNVYQYDEKTSKDMRAIKVVADINGFDLTNPEGLESAVHILNNVKESGVKHKRVDAEKINDEDGNFWSMDEGEQKYVVGRVNELLPYTDGDIETASQIAYREYEDYLGADKPWYSVGFHGGNQPYGMIFEDMGDYQDSDSVTNGVEAIKESYSESTDADTVELKYYKGNKWSIKRKDGTVLIKTVPQIKNAMKMREMFNDGLKSLDGIIEKTDILHGDRLRGKQIEKDSATMKYEIKKQQKAIEEKFGKKLSKKQEIELKRKLVPLLKARMRVQDGLSRKNSHNRYEGLPTKLDINGLSTHVSKKGMQEIGNLDINTPIAHVAMPDGKSATVRAIGYNIDGVEVVIPTVHKDGYIMSDDEAVAHYHKTGENFGKFDNPDNASRFSRALSKRQHEVVGIMKERKKLDTFKKKYLKENPKATNGEIISEYNESKDLMIETNIEEIKEIEQQNFSLAEVMASIINPMFERGNDEDDNVTHYSEDTVVTKTVPNNEIVNSFTNKKQKATANLIVNIFEENKELYEGTSITVNDMIKMAKIESNVGNTPYLNQNKDGSERTYKGIYQLSEQEANGIDREQDDLNINHTISVSLPRRLKTLKQLLKNRGISKRITGFDLYMAHQQGATGYANMLSGKTKTIPASTRQGRPELDTPKKLIGYFKSKWNKGQK